MTTHRNQPGDPLTARQKKLLRFIIDYQHEHGNKPTIREMCETFGWSAPNAPVCHLKALEQKGYIERAAKGTSRNIRVLLGPNGKPVEPPTGLTRKQLTAAAQELASKNMLSVMYGPVADVLCESLGVE